MWKLKELNDMSFGPYIYTLRETLLHITSRSVTDTTALAAGHLISLVHFAVNWYICWLKSSYHCKYQAAKEARLYIRHEPKKKNLRNAGNQMQCIFVSCGGCTGLACCFTSPPFSFTLPPTLFTFLFHLHCTCIKSYGYSTATAATTTTAIHTQV